MLDPHHAVKNQLTPVKLNIIVSASVDVTDS